MHPGVAAGLHSYLKSHRSLPDLLDIFDGQSDLRVRARAASTPTSAGSPGASTYGSWRESAASTLWGTDRTQRLSGAPLSFDAAVTDGSSPAAYPLGHGALPLLPMPQLLHGDRYRGIPRWPSRTISEPRMRSVGGLDDDDEGSRSRSGIRTISTPASPSQFVPTVTSPKKMEEVQARMYALRRSGWQVQAPALPPRFAEGPQAFQKPWCEKANRSIYPPPTATKSEAAIAYRQVQMEVAPLRAVAPPKPKKEDDEDDEDDEESGKKKKKKKKKKEQEGMSEEEKLKLIDGNQLDLMWDVFDNVYDSEQLLRQRLQVLQSTEEEARNTSEPRHATVHLAAKTRRVIEEKMQRLVDLRERNEAWQKTVSNRDKLYERVLNGADPTDMGKEAYGYEKYVKECVHRGDPRQDLKGSFELYIRSMGIPEGHSYLLYSRNLVKEGKQKWEDSGRVLIWDKANTILNPDPIDREFMKEDDARKVMKLLENCVTLVNTAGNMALYEPLVCDIKTTIGEVEKVAQKLHLEHLQRLAKAMREEIDAIIDKDNAIGQEKLAGGKNALQSADRVKNLIGMNLDRGVHPGDPQMIFAREAIKELRAESVRRDALVYLDQDQKLFKAKGWIAEAANDFADKIDKCCQLQANEHGVPRTHTKIVEALASAKELREAEGFRKREATAAKKRAEAEAKKKKEEEEARRQKLIEEEQAKRAAMKAALGDSWQG